ncbi:MAG: MerR family transcriptional regulator [Desulfovibrio sp.]|nr:MerR family transcriptional regulator [Desulfovibrio sp.]
MQNTPSAEQLLSIADISRQFSLPESTCRYYCKRFSAYIPAVGEGRRRRYRTETKEVIAAILEEMKRSRTASAVEEALAQRFPRNTPALRQPQAQVVREQASAAQGLFPSSALTLMERQAVALEGIVALLRTIAQSFANGGTNSANSVSEHAELRKEIDTLRLLLDNSEKTQQADLQQLRIWLARVIQAKRNASATTAA